MFVHVYLQVLVAITYGNDLPTLCFKAFDVVSKSWKHLTCMNQPRMKALHSRGEERDIPLTAEHIGNHLYVAVDKCIVYCYSIDQNLWEELPHSPCSINSLCAIGDYLYALGNCDQVPKRYSFSECRWQPIAKLSDCAKTECRYPAGATVFDSKLYALFGCAQRTAGNNMRGSNDFSMQKAMLYCFDPSMNSWEFLSNTCEPHFESTLFVVNDKLCVAGGYKSPREHRVYCVEPSSVEVYNAEAEYWSTVHQSHIPQNYFGAIEVEGRVYFIINNFPIDSGIRIPPDEMYHIHLDEWENLSQVSDKAVLCYLPVKRESLKTEHNENQTD